MSKTWRTITTAFLLVVLSAALIAARWYVLGAEIDGTPGASTWQVTLELEGKFTAPEGSLTTLLPPDFRRQHIANETFESGELTHKVRKPREASQRKAVWQRRPGSDAAQPFRLTYSFRCVMDIRRQTAGMVYRTQGLDAPPAEGSALKPALLIESDHEEISRLVEKLAGGNERAEGQAETFFSYVARLPTEEPAGPPVGAVACLRKGSGDAAARSRLLVALCRNRAVPARLMSGLVLEEEGRQKLHHWAEAWVEDRWLPMCPTYHQFGGSGFPDHYLVLVVGGESPVGGEGARFSPSFLVKDLHNAPGPNVGPPPSRMKTLWRKMTLGNLQPEEQEWVKFLLLLPLAALIVCVFRTLIGINTFGTFAPALLGLVCRNLTDLPWALAVFVAVILAGWGVRCALDSYHLLLVPRISALLTVIVALLVVAILVTRPSGWGTNSYVALLPLVILTHMVERFWTVEAEDGVKASFRTLLGTVTVAVVISLVVNLGAVANGLLRPLGLGPVLGPDVVRTTLFRYPEVLGLVLAAQFLVGRYTGYRLTELFRFRDLLQEEQPFGGAHELAGSLPATQGDGRPGHERPQHGVHPGPQPAPALSPGGRQAEDA